MPYKSKAQMRLFFAKEKAGELPEGTAKQWADETPNIKKLPEHVKKAMLGPFEKIAVRLKKLPPVPTAIVEQREAMQAMAQKMKGLSPVAARAAKNPRLT